MSLIYAEYLVNVHFGNIPHTFIPHFTFHSAEKISIEFSTNYPSTTFRIPQSAFRKIPLPCGYMSVPDNQFHSLHVGKFCANPVTKTKLTVILADTSAPRQDKCLAVPQCRSKCLETSVPRHLAPARFGTCSKVSWPEVILETAANVLDPHFRGEQLTEDQDIKGMQFIAKMASESGFAAMSAEFDTQVFEQLGEFRTMTGAFSHEFKWKVAEQCILLCGGVRFTAMTHCQNAMKILNVTPRSTPTECNWKHHALTQTKFRNRLDEEKMQKLVHVSSLTLPKKQTQELTSALQAQLQDYSWT